MDDFIDNYDLKLDQIIRSIGHEQASVRQQQQKLIQGTRDCLDNLETLYQELRSAKLTQGSADPANLREIKKALSGEMQKQQAARDAALAEKQQLKQMKSEMEEKITKLKREIDSIHEENHRLEAQLNQPDMPVLLKLMSSKSGNPNTVRD